MLDACWNFKGGHCQAESPWPTSLCIVSHQHYSNTEFDFQCWMSLILIFPLQLWSFYIFMNQSQLQSFCKYCWLYPWWNFHIISHLTVSFEMKRELSCSKKQNRPKTSQKIQGSWSFNGFFLKRFKIQFGLNIPNTGFADFSRPNKTSSFTFFQK